MNKDTAKDFLPLIEALAEGKTIQERVNGEWVDQSELVTTGPTAKYRIKPEIRKVWVWWPEEHHKTPVLFTEISHANARTEKLGGHVVEVTE